MKVCMVFFLEVHKKLFLMNTEQGIFSYRHLVNHLVHTAPKYRRLRPAQKTMSLKKRAPVTILVRPLLSSGSEYTDIKSKF